MKLVSMAIRVCIGLAIILLSSGYLHAADVETVKKPIFNGRNPEEGHMPRRGTSEISIASGVLQQSKVKIKQEGNRFLLLVDDSPFYVKGAACGEDVGRLGDDYLKMARELGANTVRTWGTDQGDQDYLDRAAGYGLKVVAGIWLNWVTEEKRFSYISDKDYLQDKRREILEYVKRFRKHPAILMWNIGNEALDFTRDEKERVALCVFLNKICEEVHQLDPDHLIVYAAGGTATLPYLKEYAPNLDIIGVNNYGSVRFVQSAWETLGIGKPYLLTEFGPRLPLDVPKDANNSSRELSDKEKAIIYRETCRQMQDFAGSNLGGCAFHLGETTQESMTWWNINEHAFKNLSYWAIYQSYTGKPIENYPPRIKKYTLAQTSYVRPGAIISVEVLADDAENDPLYYSYMVSTAREGVLQYYVNDYAPIVTFGAGPRVKIQMPDQPGVYRVYVFVYDNHGNVASANISLKL